MITANPAKSHGHPFCNPVLIANRNCVGAGNSCSIRTKIRIIRGMTKASIKNIVPPPTSIIRIGYASAVRTRVTIASCF